MDVENDLTRIIWYVVETTIQSSFFQSIPHNFCSYSCYEKTAFSSISNQQNEHFSGVILERSCCEIFQLALNKLRFTFLLCCWPLEPFHLNFVEVGFSQKPFFLFPLFRIHDAAEMESEKNPFTFTGFAFRFLHGFHNPSQRA